MTRSKQGKKSLVYVYRIIDIFLHKVINVEQIGSIFEIVFFFLRLEWNNISVSTKPNEREIAHWFARDTIVRCIISINTP